MGRYIRLAAVVLLVAVGFTGSDVPFVQPGDTSGIAIVGPDWQRGAGPAPPPLARAWTDALRLGEDVGTRARIGYPWMDTATGELVLTAVDAVGESRLREWRASWIGADVPWRIEHVKYSWARLEEVQEELVAMMRSGAARGARIWGSGPDFAGDRVVASVDRANVEFFAVLASRYGTELVAVNLERHRYATY